MQKSTWIILGLLMVCTSCLIYFGFHRTDEHLVINGVYLTKSRSINDFQLTDNTGKPFTKNNLLGHWTMLFFGFTRCGYICPATLTELNKMYTSLQNQLSDNDLPQVVMVSVDPERDSAARMNDYVHSYNSHFIGVRGILAATQALENELHVTAAKMQSDNQGKDQYTINHSAEIIVVNPRAEIQAYFAFPHSAERLIIDYKSILKTYV